jgi:hypothetical protein
MELTYMVRGADTKEYGPVSLQQLDGWVRERRLSAQQEVKRSDMQHWAAAGTFAELEPLFSTEPNAPGIGAPAASASTADMARVAQLKSGGSWFYWIAGLSLINSIAAASGSSWRFIVGLGVTQLFDALGAGMGNGGKIVALVLDLVAAGVFILFGVFANKGHTWAFLTGMVLFALDGAIFLLGGDWLGVAFHVLVLFFLFRGFQAARALKSSG